MNPSQPSNKRILIGLLSVFLVGILTYRALLINFQRASSYFWFGLIILCQSIIIFFNNRYVARYKNALQSLLKLVHDFLPVSPEDEIRCTLFLPNLFKTKLRCYCRYDYRGQYYTTKTKFSIRGMGQGVMGQLFCTPPHMEQVAYVKTLPLLNDDTEKFYDFWKAYGIDKKFTTTFKPNMRGIYCWNLRNRNGRSIGSVSVDTCRPELLSDGEIEQITRLFIGAFETHVQEELFIGLSKE